MANRVSYDKQDDDEKILNKMRLDTKDLKQQNGNNEKLYVELSNGRTKEVPTDDTFKRSSSHFKTVKYMKSKGLNIDNNTQDKKHLSPIKPPVTLTKDTTQVKSPVKTQVNIPDNISNIDPENEDQYVSNNKISELTLCINELKTELLKKLDTFDKRIYEVELTKNEGSNGGKITQINNLNNCTKVTIKQLEGNPNINNGNNLNNNEKIEKVVSKNNFKLSVTRAPDEVSNEVKDFNPSINSIKKIERPIKSREFISSNKGLTSTFKYKLFFNKLVLLILVKLNKALILIKIEY